MNPLTRRSFLHQAGAVSLAVAVPSVLKAANASEKTNVAFIGTGGMGMNHVRTMGKRTDVNFLWVCDADSDRAATAARTIQDLSGQTPRIEKDMRRILDDP